MGAAVEGLHPVVMERPGLRYVTRSFPRSAGIFLLFLAVTSLWFWHAWSAPTTLWVGSGTGDSMLSIWNFEYFAYAVTHHHGLFITHTMNFPQGVNLMWQTPGYLLDLLLLPVTLTLGPVFSYNLAMTLAVASSAWSVYFAACHLLENRRFAVLAGFVFLISPYMADQSLDHLFLVCVPLSVLMFVLVYDVLFLRRFEPWQAGLSGGLLVAAQFFISEELLASTLVVVILALVLAVIMEPALLSRWRRVAMTMLWVLPLPAVLCSVPLWIQLAGQGAIKGVVIPPAGFSGDLFGLVVPGITELVHIPHFSTLQLFSGSPVEKANYIGIAIIAVLACRARQLLGVAWTRYALLMLICVEILVLGTNLNVAGVSTTLPLPGAVLEHLPLLDGLLPLRMSFYADLILALLLAVVFAGLAAERVWTPRLTLVTAAICIITWLPVFPYPASSISTPQALQGLRVARGSVLVLPFARSIASGAAMLWQAQDKFGFRMVDGYFTRSTGEYPLYHGPEFNPLLFAVWNIQNDLSPSPSLPQAQALSASGTPLHLLDGNIPFYLTGETRKGMLSTLSKDSVRFVVITPMPYQSDEIYFFTKLLGRPPYWVGKSALWHL